MAKSVKEVSDKVVVILVILAVLVSIIGTVLVFYTTSNVRYSNFGSNIFSNNMKEQLAKIELYVVNPEIPAPEGVK